MAVLPIVVGADPQTRAELYRALRDGHTSNPRIDAMLRAWRDRWLRHRWLVPLAALFNLIALIFVDDLGGRVLLGVGALFMLAAVWRTERSHRQLRRYRGLVENGPPNR
jgi:hypothetical protein